MVNISSRGFAGIVPEPGALKVNAAGVQSQADAAVLLGNAVPCQGGVVRRGVDVAVKTLQLPVGEYGVSSAGLEETVHGADGQPGHVYLVPAVAHPVVN